MITDIGTVPSLAGWQIDRPSASGVENRIAINPSSALPAPCRRSSGRRAHARRAVLRRARMATVVVLARCSALGRMREHADSGCGDIPRHSQSLRSPANVMCAGEAHPAAVMLARVSCARNESSGAGLTCGSRWRRPQPPGMNVQPVGQLPFGQPTCHQGPSR